MASSWKTKVARPKKYGGGLMDIFFPKKKSDNVRNGVLKRGNKFFIIK